MPQILDYRSPDSQPVRRIRRVALLLTLIAAAGIPVIGTFRHDMDMQVGLHSTSDSTDHAARWMRDFRFTCYAMAATVACALAAMAVTSGIKTRRKIGPIWLPLCDVAVIVLAALVWWRGFRWV